MRSLGGTKKVYARSLELKDSFLRKCSKLNFSLIIYHYMKVKSNDLIIYINIYLIS
jgi:hypothetical protein